MPRGRRRRVSSRRYIKRVWRVPKDRGASAYLAALVVKALVKHGWPASARVTNYRDSFLITHVDGRLCDELPNDFVDAVAISVRICARTYRLDVTESYGFVTFDRPYVVTTGGHFREEKHDPTG